MDIEFRRTGERSYAVIARRAGVVVREIDPAPGFDARMPHDLLHYVVELELDLRLGIFGQIVGNPRTVHLARVANEPNGSRVVKRARRRVALRDAKLRHSGRDDAARSEAAVYVYGHAWRTRRAWGHETAAFSRICQRLDALSHQWSTLGVGESMNVSWPDAATRSRTTRRPRPRYC